MNWGHKIAIVIIAFILIMLGMVYVAYRQTNEMEDTNYYEKELKYQSKIDAANNLNEAGGDSILSQDNRGVIVHIPGALMTDFKNGRIEFLRSDSEQKDFNLNFAPDTSGIFLIDRSKFSYGIYKARIQWENGTKHYYKEQAIFLP